MGLTYYLWCNQNRSFLVISFTWCIQGLWLPGMESSLRVLNCYQLGTKLVSADSKLYDADTAMVWTNNVESPTTGLERGTKQGCPLSPLVFALCLETLANIIHQHPGIVGYRRGGGEHVINTICTRMMWLFCWGTHTSQPLIERKNLKNLERWQV